MGDKSAIGWTDATWNPIAGCSRVSEGCRNCYAEREANRIGARMDKYAGLTKHVGNEPRWTGEVRLWEPHLEQPLRWTKPRRIFVNSMSDLFHESVPDEWIAAMFGVMAAAPRHTFQVLTKRPERMREWFRWVESPNTGSAITPHRKVAIQALYVGKVTVPDAATWPLPNVHLGVSVEDQPTADARIQILLQTPAAVRWVSYEPALAAVEWEPFVWPQCIATREEHERSHDHGLWCEERRLDWIVVGGESGPGARPFDLAWARSTVAQCRAAGVACFVKQLGSVPMMDALRWNELTPSPMLSAANRARVPQTFVPLLLSDRKGGDPAEWPGDLRVREFPR